MANTKRQRTILYLHVDRELKDWLKNLCKAQIGFAPLSTTAEKILNAAKKNPSLIKAALGETQ